MTSNARAFSDRLSAARNAFDFSLGAYAVLTSPEHGGLITQYRISLYDDGRLETSRGDLPLDQRVGVSRTTSFNRPLPTEAALEVVHAAYARMIAESHDATQAFAKDRGRAEWDALKRESWFAFAGHLRNAFAHNGRFVFNDRAIFPAKFGQFSIEPKHAHREAKGFLPWLYGQQLCAQMTLYVEGYVDFAQRRLLLEQ